jgi:uncharacterized membrane protein YebE (DUF533 family)
MSESQHLSVIRVWAALVWADGKIAQAEAVAMRRLIEVADLSDEERDMAQSWLDAEVEPETERLASLGQVARESIYRAAVRLASVDLEVVDAERAFLKRLRGGLGISDEVAEEIESSVPGYR